MAFEAASRFCWRLRLLLCRNSLLLFECSLCSLVQSGVFVLFLVFIGWLKWLLLIGVGTRRPSARRPELIVVHFLLQLLLHPLLPLLLLIVLWLLCLRLRLWLWLWCVVCSWLEL